MTSSAPVWLRSSLLALAGTACIAVGAWVDVPMVPVPMTLQTWAVLAVGALYGPRLGPATVALYLLAAAAGLPLLAGFGSGLERLSGPTAGYLAGFVVAAWVAGRAAANGWMERRVAVPLAVMLAGHAIILSLGVAWLAVSTGTGLPQAFRNGAAPFLSGAVVKSILALVTVRIVRGVWGRRRWGGTQKNGAPSSR